ncbi:MAG: glycosyltransferase family 39 protein [Candidatus Promineifilaceae bacterium]
MNRNNFIWLVLGAILVVATFLRFWRLDSVPPGWRDDELINSLVISQHALDGELAVYYPDASGHEALYHVLNAFMLGAFGPGVAGIRWLSAILGVVTVLLTFLLGRRLFGPLAGLIAAAVLAVSFWSLMYSRTGIRHILLPALAMATFIFFLRGLGIGAARAEDGRGRTGDFLLSGFFMGLNFYSYFASRGVPLIVLTFLIYLLFFRRSLLFNCWRQLVMMGGLAFLMAVPLLVTLARQPESEARVAELAVPLVEARAGNLEPLRDHVITTLSMFHGSGDDEWLYNIPGRPVFGPFGAVLFWLGVGIAAVYALLPIYAWVVAKKERAPAVEAQTWTLSSAFLLIWWLAGISPGFISVPPASLGHTILAQPAVYLLLALPAWWLSLRLSAERRWIAVGLGITLVLAVATRDLPAYFNEWPQRGMTRFLYRADLAELAAYLNDEPAIEDFSVSSLLAGPWDRIALSIGLNSERAKNVRARWYDPQRALILSPALGFAGFPIVETAYPGGLERVANTDSIGGYQLMRVDPAVLSGLDLAGEQVCFANGLCWIGARYEPDSGKLDLAWQVGDDPTLPAVPLISNPPPPGIYAGPRLLVFAQIQDAQGNFLVGDDGLWVDAQTLQPGDSFLQQHTLLPPEGAEGTTIVFGLYDPYPNVRILTDDGRDHVRLEIK